MGSFHPNITLNGVSSTSVKGLIIQSLPPISKPLQRTQIETVDGRDGDIATPLGYAAYDKTVTVGLAGDFDIDEVIAFFDSSGTVIFSNEPDKYYRYTIVAQIDFERLLRFRTANVVFHVQPFKHSAVGEPYYFSPDQFKGAGNLSRTVGGITAAVSNGVISFSGTATTGGSEIYIPIRPVALGSGTYILRATPTGSGADACQIRLISAVPVDDDSFGGAALQLQNGAAATLSGTLAASKTYNYLWLHFNQGTAVSFSLDVKLLKQGVSSFSIINAGNTKAKPVYTISCTGAVTLYLNGSQAVVLANGGDRTIRIDVEELNAYNGTTLYNRQCTGDYESLILPVGRNTVAWSGTIYSISIENFSRWI